MRESTCHRCRSCFTSCQMPLCTWRPFNWTHMRLPRPSFRRARGALSSPCSTPSSKTSLSSCPPRPLRPPALPPPLPPPPARRVTSLPSSVSCSRPSNSQSWSPARPLWTLTPRSCRWRSSSVLFRTRCCWSCVACAYALFRKSGTDSCCRAQWYLSCNRYVFVIIGLLYKIRIWTTFMPDPAVVSLAYLSFQTILT